MKVFDGALNTALSPSPYAPIKAVSPTFTGLPTICELLAISSAVTAVEAVSRLVLTV